MKVDEYNKKVDRKYREFRRKEKRAFNQGKRDSNPATCEGNLW